MNEEPEDEERQSFEQWISGPPLELSVERWDDNCRQAWPKQYKKYEVQLAWEAWQEATRFKSQP